MKLTVYGPIRLVSEANQHEHWTARHRRNKRQQSDATFLLWSAENCRGVRAQIPPYAVTLTRFGPRRIDPGNMEGSFKHVQDAIAKWLGVDDGDPYKVTWKYQQEQGPYGLRIEIVAGGRP